MVKENKILEDFNFQALEKMTACGGRCKRTCGKWKMWRRFARGVRFRSRLSHWALFLGGFKTDTKERQQRDTPQYYQSYSFAIHNKHLAV